MSLKKQLRSRELPSITQTIQLTDATEAAAKLQAATLAHQRAVIRDDPEPLKRTKAALKRAQKAYDTCFAQVVLRALPPRDYEALICEHPPTDEQMAGTTPDSAPQWNRDTFRPALLAACAEGDMTTEDWAAFLDDHSSRGEGDALFVAALAVNENRRLPEAAMLPKESPAIGNWPLSLR